jgi:hypothetical protein
MVRRNKAAFSLIVSEPRAKPERFAHWRIHVATESGRPVSLKFAIGFDRTLDLVQTKTPFDYKFDALQFTALMSLVDSTESIVAELWSDVHGDFQKIGSFSGGPQGKFTHHPSGPTFGSSGTAF